jgi:hypothetical protein
LGADELIWECCHSSKCGCSGIHADQYLASQNQNYFADYQDLFDFHLKRRSTAAAEADYSTWQDVVEAYTRLQISFKKDIFPALSGDQLKLKLI